MVFFQTYKLFDEYFAYPKVTLMQERKSSFNNGVLQFPTIQVCNVNPLGLFRNSPNKESFKQYMALVRNVTTCKNCSEDDRRTLQRLRDDLSTVHQYVMHIGEKKAVALLSNYTDFLIDCLAFVAGNAFGSECSTVGSIIVVPSVKHIVCLVLKHPETVAIYRLSMTFYIDNFDVNAREYATVNAMATRSSGVRYFLLNPKLSEYKLFSNTVQAAPPGMLTSVNVRQHLHKRLPAPHGNCVDGVENYTFESCFEQCYDDQLMDNCKCSGFFLQRGKMCTDASLPQRQLLQNHRCLLQIRGSECALCNEICEDMDYMTTTSHTKWPLPYQYQSFYQELISDKPFSNRFVKVEDETDESSPSADAMRLIDENFVKV